MPTGNARDYVLFNPTKKVANKEMAVKIVLHHLGGEENDKSTVTVPEWGTCHIVAYTDTVGATVGSTSTLVKYGDLDWHAKKRIVMVREQPRKGSSIARITIYICEIEDLFNKIPEGKAGVKWTDVSSCKMYSKTMSSDELASILVPPAEEE